MRNRRENPSKTYERKFDDEKIARFRREEKELRLKIACIVGKMIDTSWVSREELAEALGYQGTTQFSKWKSGAAMIPPEKLALLARILGCSITHFFPESVHESDWVDELRNAFEQGRFKKTLEILLENFPDGESRT